LIPTSPAALSEQQVATNFAVTKNKKPAVIAPTIAAGLDRTIEPKPEGADRD
jgi:hypothetical protein